MELQLEGAHSNCLQILPTRANTYYFLISRMMNFGFGVQYCY